MCWTGGGAGYLLQLVSNTSPLRSLEEQSPPCPFFAPYLMGDIDAALGPGVGIAVSTYALLPLFLTRLWFKFYIGAGGGLSLGLCLAGFDPLPGEEYI